MAITIEPRIKDQLISSESRYYYLYEPLPVLITETDPTAMQISINLTLRDVNTMTPLEMFENYAVYDLNPNEPLNVDLMNIIQQAHNADVWKIGALEDIINTPESVLSPVTYQIDIASNSNIGGFPPDRLPGGSATPIEDSSAIITPILGGRRFDDFNPLVGNQFPLTDFEALGIEVRRYRNFDTIVQSLAEPDGLAMRFNRSLQPSPPNSPCAEGGMIYWKSRLGGWMQWGFELKTFDKRFSYRRDIEVGAMRASRGKVNQNPFIQTDYAEVDYTYSLTLKSLALTQDEIFAVSSISESPVCYYQSKPGGRLELMRISAATTPQNILANGADFSVSLTSISRTEFKTR